MPMKGKRILILIGGHLATAPRVQKEAAALKNAGAQVFVRGTWRSASLAEEDKLLAKEIGIDFSAVVDINAEKYFLVRIKQKIANMAFSKFGLVTPRVFGLAGPELLKEAGRLKADLTMVHSEAGLWAAEKLLADGYRVSVDFEDWFSQDLPEADRKSRPVVELQKLERYLLNNANCCFATTQVMAEELAKDANSSRIPTVIPNCFDPSERERVSPGQRDTRTTNVVSFYWFSQTIGPGRGLETLAKALPLLNGGWQLVIRGDLRGYGNWYAENFSEKLRSQIQLEKTVPNDELLARTMSHDVGLALEMPYCQSRDLTATNKIFEYLRAGLAVIATDTRGQIEVMSRCAEAGIIVPGNSPSELANAMQFYVNQRAALQLAKNEAVRAASGIWSWKSYEKLLVETVSSVLNSS